MNIQRLKDIREDKDLLQKDIAKVLKISQVQYSRYETGIRLIPLDKIDVLANYYNVSVDYLIGRTDVKEPYKKKRWSSQVLQLEVIFFFGFSFVFFF